MNDQPIAYSIIAEDPQGTNQKCYFSQINLNTGIISDSIFEFGDDGAYPDATISPNGQFVAFNKWIEKQDRELFLYDIKNKITRQLTFNSNGEINRLSWLDDKTIIGVFCSHKRGYDGWHLFSFNINTSRMKFLTAFNKAGNETVYFNGVKALTGQDKIIFARGTEREYLKSWNDSKYKNALYISDKEGSDIEEILTFEDRTIGSISISPNKNHLLVEAFKYPENNDDIESSDLYVYDITSGNKKLLEDGTTNKKIEHWNLAWLDDTTIVYRDQLGWYCLNTDSMQKRSLFSKHNLDTTVLTLIPRGKGEE